MITFEEVFIKNILDQFDQATFKRIILQDIPPFVQEKIYLYLVKSVNSNQTILFTNVTGASTVNIIAAKSKEEILSKRNDYNISQIAIISNIVLDRSNESTVTIVNDLPKDKWKWVATSFGQTFINALTENFDISDFEKEIIVNVLFKIGKNYDKGIERQWELILRLFQVFDNKGLQEKEFLVYALGLPRIGLSKDLSHSLAILDASLNSKKEKIKKTIKGEIERLGLYDFRTHILDSISFIKENSNSQEYVTLISELAELNIIVNDSETFGRIYSSSFEKFFNKLTNKSIKPLEICNSPIFYYNACNNFSETPNEWWKYLTSNFWNFVLEENRLPNEVIQVKVMNVENLFDDKIRNLTLVSSPNKGLVSFQINNFSSFQELEMKVGRQSPIPISSDNFSYCITDYIDKPETFSFISGDSKKITLKVLPVDRFACGILPFLFNSDSIAYLPYKKDGRWLCELEIGTRGQNKLILLIEENTILPNKSLEDLDDGNVISLQKNSEIQIPGIIPYECFFWIEGAITEKAYRIRYMGPSGADEELEVRLSVTKEQQDEVNSVYRRLVKEHLTRKKSNVSAFFRDDFLDLFEGWMINNPESSHKPVYLSVEQVEKQNSILLNEVTEGWHSLVKGITARKFLLNEYTPSTKLISARVKIFEFIKKTIRGPLGFSTLLRNIDFVQLGEEFEILVLEYLKEYELGLQESGTESFWFDIHPIVYDKDRGTDVITSKDIVGLVVSPYHPLRLYWQLKAQQELSRGLEKKDNYRYNPAASALDPSIVPDLILLKLRSTVGEAADNRFISLTNDSEYWGILLKADGQSTFLSLDDKLEFFWTKLGVRIEGLNQGLFPSQIERSLKDVSKLMVSKDKLKVTLQGNSKGYEEEGIFNWLKRVTGSSEESIDNTYLQEHVWGTVREKSIEIYDTRPRAVQPDDYLLLDEYSQVNQNIKWFDVHSLQGNNTVTDLSIMCNLGLSSIEMVESNEQASPAIGALLYKHRLIKVINEGTQVPLKEQWKTSCVTEQNDEPDAIFMRAIHILEGGNSNSKSCIALSPSIDLLGKALDSSHLSVVSSSLVSPATFSLLAKRNGMDELYLWDFDLPSFNNTSNTKNGYYLLAHPKLGTETSAIKSSFSKYLELFSQFSKHDKEKKGEICQSLLSEYISKGLPSLKKLIYGGNAFRGEIGNIIAIRILQGIGGKGGIIPLVQNEQILNLIIPVDPFQDIIEKMPKEEEDDRSRPDLLIISYQQCYNGSQIKITPLEVKFRTNHDSNWKDHIVQATKFSKFLNKVFALGSESILWRVAFSSIVGRMIEYGLNLSAAQIKGTSEFEQVYKLGFALLNDLFNPSKETKITFDALGRLIYINAGPNSETFEFKNEVENCKLYLNNIEAEKILFVSGGAEEFVQGNDILRKGWNLTEQCPPLVHKAESVKNEEVNNTKEEDKVVEVAIQESSPEPAVVHTDPSISSFNPGEYLKNYPLGLNIQIGKTSSHIGEKEYCYNPGSTNINQLNIGVIGDLGTGKTQLLKSLIYNMSKDPQSNRGKSPKFLVLDTKRDYDGTGSELDRLFLNKIGADVLIPYKLRFNLFDIQNSTEINPALTKAKFFIDVLTKIYGGIGPVQKDQLLEAILSAYKKRGYKSGGQYDAFVSPTLLEIRDEYREMVNQTDAPLAIMNTLIHEELFEEDASKTVSFSKLFDKSLIVALGKISSSNDSLKLIMVVFLKLYQEYMLSIEKAPYLGSDPSLRKVDSFILIDEAKLIMDYSLPVLEDLLRKGREFGVGVILSTQYLSDFTSGKLDYKEPLSTWFIHKVPNISVKELKSIGITESNDSLVTQIQTLAKHFCLYKTVDVNGKIIRGNPLFEQMIIP